MVKWCVRISKEEEVMKTCKKCKINKEDILFSKNKKQKDNLCNWCKKCTSEYKKIYSKKNKEELSAKKKKYYQETREERLAYVTAYNAAPDKKAKKQQYDHNRYLENIE